ncbi:MAG TPA: bifunctional riboflavin kinase/FAD synthetase [Gammaproteobacteria bacterium]
MKLYRSVEQLGRCAERVPRVVAIGVFDGLHLGHQEILGCAKRLAEAHGWRTAVSSFEPMPAEFFAPDDPPARLTRFRERFEGLEKLGVDDLFCPRFAKIRLLSHEEYVERILVHGLAARHVVVGDDFRFGAGRRGTLEDLRSAGARHGFGVTVVPPVYRQGVRISSTAIREALRAGDLDTARAMLGRDYSMSGRVVRGLGLGKRLGFPTANVNLKRRQAPIDGIFAARVTGLGERPLDGVASVGTRPTIGGGRPLLEVLIFDFDADIYDRYITVHFVKRLREERRFPDLESLQRQMRRDVEEARAALAA